jgi:hypothetical protein
LTLAPKLRRLANPAITAGTSDAVNIVADPAGWLDRYVAAMAELTSEPACAIDAINIIDQERQRVPTPVER